MAEGAPMCGRRRCWIGDTEHYHSPERPNVTVFYIPEWTLGRTTVREGWGVDDCHSTMSFATVGEAVDACWRVFRTKVEVPSPEASAGSPTYRREER